MSKCMCSSGGSFTWERSKQTNKQINIAVPGWKSYFLLGLKEEGSPGSSLGATPPRPLPGDDRRASWRQFPGGIYNLLLSHQPSVSAFSPDGGGGRGVVCLMLGPGWVWKK